MALTRIIAHRIERTVPTEQARIQTRQTCWSQDGRIEECFREMKQAALKRSGKDYGRFSDDRANHPLASWLEEYHAEKMSFESFTAKAMAHIKLELDKTEVVTGAFFVFAHEKLEEADFLHIYFVQHNSGQYIDAELEMAESFYLDTDGVRLAAKINLDDWLGEDVHRKNNAVTLLRWRGEKELSEVFEASIGFAEKIDLTAETEAFLEVVNEYTKELPDVVKEYTKAQVVDYCMEQDKVGKPVVIKELSTQLIEAPKLPTEESYTPPPPFSEFIKQNKPLAKPELIPDKAKLRQYVRISGRNDFLSMSFASSCLGDTVVYDAESDSLTIKNIPPSLKSRLLKHVRESD
ncbi:nucleoid-associated protein [Saccharophagus degradans]|uniref:37kDa nucleoid-associated protein n=1 Tax=Saccharophagus degradans (strain 2-40 / ATCC 43961 / DSM 17024) TaxID=203122 RepID=Q21KS0_SACD2|nr:nucleoid-associated protein [Saccharophagus degradans]ABD80709.1 37kDa nucleoid-associated protein [Saccharophagus degradans 2-40]